MKALVYQGPRILTLEEYQKPEPGPGEALIRVLAVGICGSEIEGYLGYNSLRVPPLVMGHEFTGEIVALGPIEDNQATPSIGQKVAINPLISCGDCTYCRAGLVHVCSTRKLIGAHRPGAFANYVVVPLSAILPLPENLDPIIGALTEPFAVALHGAALGQIKAEDAVVVWGAGSIGLLAIASARLANPRQIIAVDTNASRLDAARLMGATTALDAREGDVVATIRKLLADVPHTVVLDAVGRDITRQLSVAAAGPAGRVVFLGLHDKDTTFDINGLIRAEASLQGSYAYTPEDVRQAVSLLAAGHVATDIWMDVRPLEQGSESFAELVDRPGAATKIILIP